MMTKFDVIIVGAGIAGCSVAAELSRHNSVLLLETEGHAGYHSTGRSAAIFAQSYGSSLIRAVTALAEPFYLSDPEGFSESPLLTPRGLLRLGRTEQMDRLNALYSEMSADTPSLRWIDAQEAEERLPLLKKGIIEGGFSNDDARDIDVHALQTGYLRLLKNSKGHFANNAEVVAIAKHGNGWEIKTREETYNAPVIVNAAGAWADHIAGLAGVKPVGIQPLKRSAITFDAPDGFDVMSMPMFVDADEEFYLKPEGGRLMASPADETPCPPSDCQADEMDVAVCADKIMQHFNVDIRRIHSRWAGLRSFVSDRDPICGFDPEQQGFFWLAGQGGSGVQTAPALAKIAADLVAGNNPENIKLSQNFTASDLSLARLSGTK